MAKRELIQADATTAEAKKNEAYFKGLLHEMHMGGAMSSMREADYRGHHITIRTTYEVAIDGKPFTAELGVSNAGTVHYHGMPNTAFASALDLVKSVIDTFPDEFVGATGDHSTMPGMDMSTMPGMDMHGRSAPGRAAPGSKAKRARKAAKRAPTKRPRKPRATRS